MSGAVLIPLLLTQAGGGGAFGGGGGGGGGDDGLPIELLYWLVRLAIHYPAVGVPLLIAVLVVFVLGTRRGWWKHQERVIHKARPLRATQASRDAAERLRQSDPAFDTAAFTARVERAFRKAQEAWCAQALEPLRVFVSDGVFERFSLQVAQQREEGWRQGMDGLRVESPVLQHVELGRHFETVTLRIAFEADIHRIALSSGKRIANSSLPRSHFEECWSFVRRRGARTRNAEGLIEGQCPGCGAPLNVNQSAKCASCGVLVRSGEHDWVLAEITQASEWRPEDERAAPGLESFERRDAGISVQMLEDRVSVAFWRWSEATRTRRVDPLVRAASAEFCEREAERLALPKAGSPRVYLADRAVGAVRTLGLLPGESRDRAVVEVTWDGRFANVAADGAIKLDEQRVLRRTLFVLERPAGLVSKLGDAFATSSCTNCGAHDSGGLEPRCAYCGVPRVDGGSGWLLNEVVERGEARHGELVRECEALWRRVDSQPRGAAPATPALSRAGLLVWVVAAARSDGEVDASERRAIESLAERLGDPREHVEALLAMPAAELPAPQPREREQAVEWLTELCLLAMADGRIPQAEQDFLRRVAQRFSIAQSELAGIYEVARNRLYRESKAARAQQSSR